MNTSLTGTRIGIYAGTFDPVHAGHVSFARAALDEVKLSKVYFLPERHPRFKPHASPIQDRLAALRDVVQAYPGLEVLELPDTHFTVQKTFSELATAFPDSKISLLIGSDVLKHLRSWPGIEHIVRECEFIVGMRKGSDEEVGRDVLYHLGVAHDHVSTITTQYSGLSSTSMRQKL